MQLHSVLQQSTHNLHRAFGFQLRLHSHSERPVFLGNSKAGCVPLSKFCEEAASVTLKLLMALSCEDGTGSAMAALQHAMAECAID